MNLKGSASLTTTIDLSATVDIKLEASKALKFHLSSSGLDTNIPFLKNSFKTAQTKFATTELKNKATDLENLLTAIKNGATGVENCGMKIESGGLKLIA